MRSLGMDTSRAVFVIHATKSGERDMWYTTDDDRIVEAALELFKHFKWSAVYHVAYRITGDVK